MKTTYLLLSIILFSSMTVSSLNLRVDGRKLLKEGNIQLNQPPFASLPGLIFAPDPLQPSKFRQNCPRGRRRNRSRHNSGRKLQGTGIITNGLIKLGVDTFGQLNIPGGSFDALGMTKTVGLRYILPDGTGEAEATSYGCLCEGWGAMATFEDDTTEVAFADNARLYIRTQGTELEFSSDETNALSKVDSPSSNLRVTHDFHPSVSQNLYEVLVMLENIGTAPFKGLVYRRVMDWDIYPTPFTECVTTQPDPSTVDFLATMTNNGFADVDPAVPLTWALPSPPSPPNFTDVGPLDHGAAFDFTFGALNPGENVTFKIYYGAGANTTEALDALGLVNAEVYSLGKPMNATTGGCADGPNAFIFGFTGVGGAIILDKVPPEAICKNISIQLNATGEAKINATDIDGGSHDAAGIGLLVASKSEFSCGDVGANLVTLDVTDVNGNSAQCTSMVTVLDDVPPNVVCQNTTIQLNPLGMATISTSDIDGGSDDACGIVSLDISKYDFDCGDVGTNQVILNVTDLNGNSAQCTSSVTIDENYPGHCSNTTTTTTTTPPNTTTTTTTPNNESTTTTTTTPSSTTTPSKDDCKDPYARKVKLQSITGAPVQVFDVEVYSSEVDVAEGKTAMQSTTDNALVEIDDPGDGGAPVLHTRGGATSWWEIDLGELFPIKSVKVFNEWCRDPSDVNGCLCRLSYATLSLFGDQDQWVHTQLLGDTCGMGIVEHIYCNETTAEEPTMLNILALDRDLMNLGGAINTIYPFELAATQIPTVATEVRFEWAPGYGSGGFEVVEVVDNEARTPFNISYPVPGTFNISAFVYNGMTQLAKASLEVWIQGPILTILPPIDITAGVEESYLFEANGIPILTENVFIEWSFGTGEVGVGNSDVLQVNAGEASASATFTYQSNGGYGLVAAVRDVSTNEILAKQSASVFVGPYVERGTVYACGDWSTVQSGELGMTVDYWDISLVPIGAVFDLSFNMHSIPDKLLVEYDEDTVLDTGWRGSSSYDGNALYPGGVKSPGQGNALEIFTRLSHSNKFYVTTMGADQGTVWEYRVRCREPGSTDQSSLFAEEEELGFEWSQSGDVEPVPDRRS